MGDFEGWDDYNFMWTQWKSNKIIDSLKPYKEIQQDCEQQSIASTHHTDKDCSSSTENLITTPKRTAKS
jgi:hypothetical protein